MKVDLVLEGGGILGIAFIGAYSALEAHGYEINRIAGSSAGALMAALINSGLNSQELIELVDRTDFSKFAKKTKLTALPCIGKISSLFYNKGIYSNAQIKTWLDPILSQKSGLTFKEDGQLKIIASDITNRKVMIIPDDLPYYGLKETDFQISDAVVMSTAIPYYYEPIALKNGEKIDYIVDGGLLSNFPIWIFDVENQPRWPTFGIKIQDQESFTSQGKTGFISYTRDLVGSAINKDETAYVKDKDLVRTIIINHDNHIKTTDFDIDKDDIQYLFQCGYKSTMQFLSQFDFKWYKYKYRSDGKY